MNTFSLIASCSLLDVDPKTLRRWLSLAHLAPQADPLDARQKYLTLQQLSHLARRHARPLPAPPTAPPPPPPPQVPSSLDPDLRAPLAALETRVSLLQEQVIQLTAALIRERDLRLQQLVGVTKPLRPAPVSPQPPVASATSPDGSAPAPLNPLPRHLHPPVIPLIETREDGSVVLICPQRGILSLVA